jgi:hypothetical protein
MIEPGTARTLLSVSGQFAALDARANAIEAEDIVAGSVRREELDSGSGTRVFTDSIVQDWRGDVTLQILSADTDKAVSAATTLLSVDFASVTPGGADGARGCYGLLITWTTYLKTCHVYRGVGDVVWAGVTKGPADSACVVETWLEVRDGSDPAVVIPGTRRYLRAGSRQVRAVADGVSLTSIEHAAYLTCDGACLLTEERLTAISVDSVSQVQLRARYVMTAYDYGNIVPSVVATPEAVLTDTVVTVHIVRNGELS